MNVSLRSSGSGLGDLAMGLLPFWHITRSRFLPPCIRPAAQEIADRKFRLRSILAVSGCQLSMQSFVCFCSFV